MDQLRRTHNDAKRLLINSVTSRDDYVLDVGCGRGGDVHKWKSIGVNLFGIDPDSESIKEARSRAMKIGFLADYTLGDISKAPAIQFDVVCYNFSLQYIFANSALFEKSIDEISKRMKKDSFLIGVVPDADKILKLDLEWTDPLGNKIQRGPGAGRKLIGEMILVKLSDGPYYSNGVVPEPLCYRDILTDALANRGIVLEKWDDFLPYKSGLVSDIYSKFIYRKI